jgi:hypothetical protein
VLLYSWQCTEAMYRVEFINHHYSASRLSQLDSAWYVMYFVMTVVGKW